MTTRLPIHEELNNIPQSIPRVPSEKSQVLEVLPTVTAFAPGDPYTRKEDFSRWWLNKQAFENAMTPSGGWQTPSPACPEAQYRKRRQNAAQQEGRSPCLSVRTAPWNKAASNAVIWLTDPNLLGMLKNSLVSYTRVQNQITLSLDEIVPWVEMKPSLVSPSAHCTFTLDLFSLSCFRVICIYVCLSSPLDCKPERQM